MTAGAAAISNNDWRMVRMYELMEDFEEVLARAPISTSQALTLSMGGGKSTESNWRTMDAAEWGTAGQDRRRFVDCESGGSGNMATRGADGAVTGTGGGTTAGVTGGGAPTFAAGNCLSGGCCYNSSSTESDTVPRPDQSKSTTSTSKYKKQRERLLSRPTL